MGLSEFERELTGVLTQQVQQNALIDWTIKASVKD